MKRRIAGSEQTAAGCSEGTTEVVVSSAHSNTDPRSKEGPALTKCGPVAPWGHRFRHPSRHVYRFRTMLFG
eukprot:5946235-Prymnesium_polylepis.1